MTPPQSLDLGLEGRVAIVTGAASGIAAASVSLLADAGARVVGSDVNADGLRRTMEALSDPKRHRAVIADVADPEAAAAIKGEAERSYGRIDILVNAAGMLRRENYLDMTPADFMRIVDINLRSQFLLCQAVLPMMRRARWGRIVNFTSPGAFLGVRTRAADYIGYSVSKAGLLGLTRSIARAYGPENICANLISPGTVDTPMGRQEHDQASLAALVASTPLGRTAMPGEIAHGVVFLASAWASYVNGHVLVMDGGATMHG